MTTDYDRIASAIRFIDESSARQPSLEEIAAHLSLSPGHLQRLFKRWAGVSPKRFLQFLTLEHAKALLDESVAVLDASFAVGLSGPSRLHDLFVAVDGVTPGQYRASGSGLTIRWGHHHSPFGRALVGITDRGVCELSFTGEDPSEALGALSRAWPGAEIVENVHATSEVVEAVFGSGPGSGSMQGGGSLMLFVRGTNFQLKVWRALLRVPEGALVSYSDLACRIGEPTAVRAVASAVGANPVGYIIPCHRVLRSNGAIGGYAGGVDRKRAILAKEAAGR